MDASKNHGSLLGAIAEYTEILASDPRSPVFVQLSDAYRQLGMADDALHVARAGVQQLPNHTAGHILLGRLLAERNDSAGAMVSFETALSLDANALPALKGLARLHYQQGGYDAARTLLVKAAAICPADAMVRKALASLPQASAPASPSTAGSEPAAQQTGAPIATPTIAEIYERQGFPQRALGV
jgi:tetratricopeptide (TPR) repeat protein